MRSARSPPWIKLLVAGLALAASQAHAATVEKATRFGVIAVVEEERRRDPGQVPLIHVADEWTKLHLRWTSRDGVMTVDVADDGERIEAVVDGAGCSSSSSYLQYSGAGELEIADMVRGVLASLDRACPRFAKGVAYAPTLADGAEDFAAAEAAMRAQAVVLFKRPSTRCLPPRDQIPMVAGPYQAPPCR
jgi:hypothetical protein